jgi:hypothetical protein
MMTLRYMDPGGHEDIIPLVSASFDPETKVLLGHGTPDGEHEWTRGRAFLMNEHGKTVAVFRLNPQQ